MNLNLRDRNLRVIFSVTLMAVLGVSSITPAFPKIIEALGISPRDIGLLITFFTLPGILLTPVFGLAADRWGRKRILLPSLMLFGGAGILCAFAPDFRTLLIFRLVQGVGAASLGSLNVTLIGDLYSGSDRPAVMGYNASVLSIGTASYPAIGGALAMIGWRTPFLLSALAFPVAFYALFALQNPEPEPGDSIRKQLGKTWRRITSAKVLGLFIVSAVTFIILFGSYLTYFPILIGNRFGTDPFIIGLIMSFSSLATAVIAARLGPLTDRYSGRGLLKCAFILYAVSLVMMLYIPQVWMFLLPAALFGIAQGINIPIVQTMLAGLAPIEHRGVFMSVNGMVLRIGQTAGPIAMGVLFVAWGIEGVFIAGAALAAGLLILVLAMMRR
jgi:ACDE family multidrug resistance protein